MKLVKKVVLTGGPCGGKSSAKKYIEDYFNSVGYRVIFVPEAATEVISSGIKPSDCDVIDFESRLIKKQIDNERFYEELANIVSEDKILMVYDRGLLDNKAYMTNEEFLKCLELNNITYEEAKERYDACFHLVSAANGAEEYYNFDNAARSEPIEEARVLDNKTLSSWVGHSHLRVIGNDSSFEDKMKNLINEISLAIGDPKHFEIENKYLVEMPDKNVLDNLEFCEKVNISQTYIEKNNDFEIRLRKRSSNNSSSYFVTLKRKITDLKREENEYKISENKYYHLLDRNLCRSVSITKDRYCFCYKSQYFEMDIYPDMDKALLEIELNSEDQVVELPPFIDVIKDVTNNSNYENYNLAVTQCSRCRKNKVC